MGLMGSIVQRLPLSPAMFYLAIGYALGPSGIALIMVDPYSNAQLLTLVTEIALLISLFAVGLKLRVHLRDRIWRLPFRLGIIGMMVTTSLVACICAFFLRLPWGVAILAGAILSPTDPVLASDVQVRDAGDRDRIRFSLSGEGGLNDGTAYPVVMFSLFLLGVPDADHFGSPLAAVQVVWGLVAGLCVGWVMGTGVFRLALYLRESYRQALGMEEFLTLGLIAVTYGVASLVHGVGFVAVFAAGVAMRRIEYETSGPEEPASVIGLVPSGNVPAVATDPKKAPAYMAETVLGINQQLEHIAEFALVLMIGIMLSTLGFSAEGALIGACLLLVVRPVSVVVSLYKERVSRLQRMLMCWFGIRGIGSLYYLMFALQYEWSLAYKERVVSIVLTAVALSILVHGISATPLMDHYYERRKRHAPE